jgi:hypothetical protein
LEVRGLVATLSVGDIPRGERYGGDSYWWGYCFYPDSMDWGCETLYCLRVLFRDDGDRGSEWIYLTLNCLDETAQKYERVGQIEVFRRVPFANKGEIEHQSPNTGGQNQVRKSQDPKAEDSPQSSWEDEDLEYSREEDDPRPPCPNWLGALFNGGQVVELTII